MVGNDAAFKVMRRIAVLPTINEGCGSYPGCKGGKIGIGTDKPELRLVAVYYYYHLAMMTAACVEITGGEGSMAHNSHYLDLLSAAVIGSVIKQPGGTGTSAGIAILAVPEYPH